MSGGGSQKVSRVLDDIRDEPRTVAPCPVEKHRVFGSGVLARWLPVYPKADIQAGKKLSPARKLVFFFLWEMQWAVTSASLQSQTKVARTFSQAHNVYRGIKAGVADSKAPRGHGRTAGDRSLLKGTSPQFKPVVAMWGCGLSTLGFCFFERTPKPGFSC